MTLPSHQRQNIKLVNITNDNNFYISNRIIEQIHWKIHEHKRLIEEEGKQEHEVKHFEATKEELELLKLVEDRIKKCASENIHYWVMPNSQQSHKSYCFWCGMKITDYH